MPMPMPMPIPCDGDPGIGAIPMSFNEAVWPRMAVMYDLHSSTIASEAMIIGKFHLMRFRFNFSS